MGLCESAVETDFKQRPGKVTVGRLDLTHLEKVVNAQPAIPDCPSTLRKRSPTLPSVAEYSEPDITTHLTDYFSNGYVDGELYEGPHYDGHYDDELGTSLLIHGRSGIVVWSEALDLRASEQGGSCSSQVLFHYTARSVFKAAIRGDQDPQALMELIDTVGCGDFGPGLLANASEPDTFGYKDDVLINNHWPRVADPNISDKEHETWLLAAGDSAAGPGDSYNLRVVDAILDNPAHHGHADFCIPIIVPHCFVFDIWKRWPTQMSKTAAAEDRMIGYNQWGDKQWKGRDICMIHLSDDGKAMLADMVPQKRLEIVSRRVAHLEGARGRVHADTVAAVEYLAVLLHGLGRYHDAVKPLQRAVDCRLAVKGESHSQTLTAQRCLGRCLKDVGRLEEAEELFRNMVECCEKTFGHHNPTTLLALSDLAMLVRSAGKHAIAIDLLGELLQRRQSKLDSWPADWEMMQLKRILAILLQGQGRFDEAQEHLTDLLDFAAESVADPLDIAVFQPQLDLAMLFKAMGDIVRAQDVFRQALSVCEAKLGKHHHETLNCLEELAVLLQASGQQVEAEELLRRVVHGREKTHGKHHPDTLAALDSLAMCLKASGKHSSAAPLLRSVLERSEQALGPHHPSTLAAIIDLAMVLPAAEKSEELALLLKRALELWQLQGKPSLKAHFAEPSHAMMVIAAALDGARYATTCLESWRKTGAEEQDLSKVIEAHLDADAVAVEQVDTSLNLQEVIA